MFRRNFLKILACLPFFSKIDTKNCLDPNSLVLMTVKNIYKQNMHNVQLRKIVFQYKPRIECIVTEKHSFLTVRNNQTIGYAKIENLLKNDKIWIQLEDLYDSNSLSK